MAIRINLDAVDKQHCDAISLTETKLSRPREIPSFCECEQTTCMGHHCPALGSNYQPIMESY